MVTIEQMLWGLFLSLFAGLSTTLGAITVFIIDPNDSKIISLSMGFSAGVMLGVSIFELLPEAIINLEILAAGVFFLLGMVAVALLDYFIPHEYMHERSCSDTNDLLTSNTRNPRLLRTGLLVAIGIGIHNLPEGFVTITGSLYSIELGLILAIAIALHNIPEGLSAAIPIYAASGNRRKAFGISFLSGLAEPVGAIIGLIGLLSLGMVNEEIVVISLAVVAGIMTFISLDELLPIAHETCNDNGNGTHIVTAGILAGMAVMLATLIIL
ncbi:MAG: ZIP family metal transporter [Promethearchaeota archaeon]